MYSHLLKQCSCGTNKKQVARLVEKYGPTKRKEAPTYKGISLFMLRGALGPHIMKDWTVEEREELGRKLRMNFKTKIYVRLRAAVDDSAAMLFVRHVLICQT